jgi:hypothetical protein
MYPLGHIPYGRLAVAPVGLDGERVYSTEHEPQVGNERQPDWHDTLFGSVFAAIHESTIKLTDPRWWATQAPERLAQGAAILGVHPELSVQAADAIAFRLEIPRLVLRQAAGEYERAHGRAARGRVLAGVLGELGDACLLDRVLATGACAGCWGTVTRWDGASGGARGRVFPGAARRGGDGRLVALAPVDLAHNAVSRRAVPSAPAPDDDDRAPRTAAQLAFARDFAPVVGPEGGFPATPNRSSTTKGKPR